MSQVVEVRIPDIGGFKDVPVIEVFVKPGDAVKPEDSLITLESDKATMEVPSPATGVVKELRVKVGDKVSEGSLILTLESSLTPPLAKGGKEGGVAAKIPLGPPLPKGGSAAGGFAPVPQLTAQPAPRAAPAPAPAPEIPPSPPLIKGGGEAGGDRKSVV